MKVRKKNIFSDLVTLAASLPIIWFFGIAAMIAIGLINILLRSVFGVHYFFGDYMGSGQEVLLLVLFGPFITLLLLAIPASLIYWCWPKGKTTLGKSTVKNQDSVGSGKRYWKCSGCGSVLIKRDAIHELSQVLGTNVRGGTICEICNKRHDAQAVYSGKHDFRSSDALIDAMLADQGNVTCDTKTKTLKYKGKIVE